MANWFKLGESDADETRMRYAISKLPEVWPVWTGVLMECCKHRSDTIRWGEKAHELFGFSERFKISIPKVNEAINILDEIEYIKKGNSELKVLKWKDKQDDYLTRKERGDYSKKIAKHSDSPIVSDNIGASPTQERRGEENKGEERENGSPAQFSETPSWEEFWEYCQSPHCGIAAEFYAKDKFWLACQDKWKGKSDWRSYARRVRGWWDNDGRPMKPNQNHANNGKTNNGGVDRNAENLNAGKASNYRGIKSAGVGGVVKV